MKRYSKILIYNVSVMLLVGGCAVESEENSKEFGEQKILAEFRIAKGEDIILSSC